MRICPRRYTGAQIACIALWPVLLIAQSAANDEAAFDQVWHYEDALRTGQHFLGDSFVGSRHNRLENIDGFLHAVDRVFPRRASPGEGSDKTNFCRFIKGDYPK